VFERAAYTKMGVRLYSSPLNYRSPGFITGAQWWPIDVTNNAELPAFTRLDVEVSSRVRAMMIFMGKPDAWCTSTGLFRLYRFPNARPKAGRKY